MGNSPSPLRLGSGPTQGGRSICSTTSVPLKSFHTSAVTDPQAGPTLGAQGSRSGAGSFPHGPCRDTSSGKVSSLPRLHAPVAYPPRFSHPFPVGVHMVRLCHGSPPQEADCRRGSPLYTPPLPCTGSLSHKGPSVLTSCGAFVSPRSRVACHAGSLNLEHVGLLLPQIARSYWTLIAPHRARCFFTTLVGV